MANAGAGGAVTDREGTVAGSAAADLFAGPGEMRARCRQLDWAATPLGPPAEWPVPLRATVRLMLGAPVPTSLWVGPEYTLLYNDAYARLIGVNHPDALGRPGAVAWAEAWPAFAERFDAIRAGGAPEYAEEAYIPASRLPGGVAEDAWFTYSLSAVTDEDGRCLAVYDVAVEVTGRVLSERSRAAARAALERERAEAVADRASADLARGRLEALLEHLPVGVTLAEAPSGRLLVSNAAVREIWGLDTPAAQVADYSALYVGFRAGPGPEAGRQYASDDWPLARALATGRAVMDELIEILRPDGTRVLVSVSAAPVRDAAGTIVGGVVMTQDVTERARLFEAEREARLVAEEANLAKGRFLSAMSHELRTPLNAIGGYVELIQLGIRGPVTPEQLADLARVRHANEYLLGLISDILNFARLEAGRLEMEVEDVVIARLVGEIEPLVAPQMAEKRITFSHEGCTADSSAAPHAVRADAERLRQVLLNLLTNAVKFTGDDGRVALECETDAAAGLVRIRVRDTGRGIPADALRRIFEPFVQLDRHLTLTSQQGVGLGLAISHELMLAMGGDLTAESTLGVGSTFTLTLPRA